MQLDGIDWSSAPWRGVADAALHGALAVPSMLSDDEARLYHWLGTLAEGWGAAVDLGAFAGGSAARLLSGLALGGSATRVHAFDRFTARQQMRERYLYPKGMPEQSGMDILPAVERFLAPWAGRVDLVRGDIATLRWTGGPVEILAVDAGKSPALADRIAAEFFPALEPGRSVLIQQDFLHAAQPWLAVQMARLAPFFTPVARAGADCVVFLPRARPDAAALAAARTEGMEDAALVAGLRAAARVFAPVLPAPRFRAMIRKVEANPGIRLAWQMKN